jgi:hypothetical protein
MTDCEALTNLVVMMLTEDGPRARSARVSADYISSRMSAEDVKACWSQARTWAGADCVVDFE